MTLAEPSEASSGGLSADIARVCSPARSGMAENAVNQMQGWRVMPKSSRRTRARTPLSGAELELGVNQFAKVRTNIAVMRLWP